MHVEMKEIRSVHTALFLLLGSPYNGVSGNFLKVSKSFCDVLKAEGCRNMLTGFKLKAKRNLQRGKTISESPGSKSQFVCTKNLSFV